MKRRLAVIGIMVAAALALAGCVPPGVIPDPIPSPPTWIQDTWDDDLGFQTFTFTEDSITFSAGLTTMDIGQWLNELTDAYETKDVGFYEVGGLFSIAEVDIILGHRFIWKPDGTMDYWMIQGSTTIGPLNYHRHVQTDSYK